MRRTGVGPAQPCLHKAGVGTALELNHPQARVLRGEGQQAPTTAITIPDHHAADPTLLEQMQKPVPLATAQRLDRVLLHRGQGMQAPLSPFFALQRQHVVPNSFRQARATAQAGQAPVALQRGREVGCDGAKQRPRQIGRIKGQIHGAQTTDFWPWPKGLAALSCAQPDPLWRRNTADRKQQADLVAVVHRLGLDDAHPVDADQPPGNQGEAGKTQRRRDGVV